MKFANPITKPIREQIAAPIEKIGIIALFALLFSIGAFILAIGK